MNNSVWILSKDEVNAIQRNITANYYIVAQSQDQTLWMSSHAEDLRPTGFWWEDWGVLGPARRLLLSSCHKAARQVANEQVHLLSLYQLIKKVEAEVKAKWKN